MLSHKKFLRRAGPDLLALILCLGVFSFFYFPSVRLTGLPGDDAGLALESWRFLERILGLLRDFSIPNWRTLDPPLLANFKHGPGELYLNLPFVWLWGHASTAIVWRSAAFAGLTIAATYGLGRALYRDRWAAFLAALLLASSPSFVAAAMGGTWTGIVAVGPAVACLCFLLVYADSRKPQSAYLGCACLGLALASRTQMAAFALGLAVYLWLFRRAVRALLPAQPSERRRFLLGCLASFSLFMLPWAIGLILRRGYIFSCWAEHSLLRGAPAAGNNLDYGSNLLLRLGHLGRILNGTAHLGMYTKHPDLYRVQGGWLVAAAALAALAWGAYRLRRREPPPRRWALPWIIGVSFLLVSPLSPTALKPLHLLPLLPLIYLAACCVIEQAAGTRWRVSVLAASLCLAAGGVWSSFRFFRRLQGELALTGGREAFTSRSALDLCPYFAARPGVRVVSFVDGLADLLAYCSGDTIAVDDIAQEPGLLPLASHQEAWNRIFDHQEAAYVFDLSSDGPKYPMVAFQKEAARRGLRPRPADTIARPNGEPVFALYQLAR